jgi:hypothetical protein
MYVILGGHTYTLRQSTGDHQPQVSSFKFSPCLPLEEHIYYHCKQGEGYFVTEDIIHFSLLIADIRLPGVAPDNAYERGRTDMIVDSIKDMEDKMGSLFWENDEERKVLNK